MRKIIVFTGAIGAGKSTCVQLLPPRFKRISFADPLKKMLMALGLTSEDVYGGNKEKPNHLLGGLTPRYAMQTLGTEWGRDMIHPNLWVYAWRRQVDNLLPEFNVAVDDARFPNEFMLLQEMGAKFVSVWRQGAENKTMHSSESFKPPQDYVLPNNTTIRDLELRIRKLLLVDMI